MEKLLKVSLSENSKNSEKEFPFGTTLHSILKAISKNGKAPLAMGWTPTEDIFSARLNGKNLDLSSELKEEGTLEFLNFADEEAKAVFRHSASHIMAQALRRFFPKALYSIGPPIQDGFYYDFDLDRTLTPEDLEKIEKEMQNIVEENHPFYREEMPIEKAIQFFSDRGDSYKVEILQELKEQGKDSVSIYTQGDFIDLCRGPHIPSTRYLKAFKLLHISGAYWRGDSRNKMLQRIYGTAFSKEEDLSTHLYRIEEAKRRDHRKLGTELDLFSLQEEGAGFPFWHPKGMQLYRVLEEFIRAENQKRNYQEVKTPIVLNRSLWEKSGHYANFKENMFLTQVDEKEYALKPMNCPGHGVFFRSQLRSYRDLPMKVSEFGLVHRHELSGVLHGLFRARSFTQDDAHIYCLSEQLTDQILELLDYVHEVYKKVGFERYQIMLGTRPEKKYIGEIDLWKKATHSLKEALKIRKLDYKILEGEGAFYGPKIDFHIEDSLARLWQCGTIQVDFSLPERLGLFYEGPDDKKHPAILIHRAILGSMERFIGILIEHYGGKFPFWLAPIQIEILPVLPKHRNYAIRTQEILNQKGFRTEINQKEETLGYKIRNTQLKKIPFMLILGDREEENNSIAIRERDTGQKTSLSNSEMISFFQSRL